MGSITRRGGVREDLAHIYDIFPRLSDLRTRQAGYTSGGEAADDSHRAGAHGAPQASTIRRTQPRP